MCLDAGKCSLRQTAFFFRKSTGLFISVSILHHLFRKKERISTLEAHTL